MKAAISIAGKIQQWQEWGQARNSAKLKLDWPPPPPPLISARTQAEYSLDNPMPISLAPQRNLNPAFSCDVCCIMIFGNHKRQSFPIPVI